MSKGYTVPLSPKRLGTVFRTCSFAAPSAAEFRLPEARGEELHALAPVRMGPGYRFSMSCSISDLKILEDFTASRKT